MFSLMVLSYCFYVSKTVLYNFLFSRVTTCPGELLIWMVGDMVSLCCVDFSLKVANATTYNDNCVESAWAFLKKSLLEAATVTCGL